MQNLEELYDLRSNFLIIGLTGRLGSGCSSTAELLVKDDFSQCGFPIPEYNNFESNEERKYRITHTFLKENWQGFTLIRASDIIVTLLLKEDFDKIRDFLLDVYSNQKDVVGKIYDSIKDKFEEVSRIARNLFLADKNYEFVEDAYKEILQNNIISDFSTTLKDAFKPLTSSIASSPFQNFGDNIRKTGSPINNGEQNTNLKNAYIISDLIKQLIKQYRKSGKRKVRIVIDSIRNSFEARYFRERYSAFYLFAVNTENEYRFSRLTGEFNKEQIKNLDVEYDKDLKISETFYKQDIKSCIQMADVYLYNPNDNADGGDTKRTLKISIVRYLSLIYQPGIITPTPEERTMQIAYTAKYNSGCISRQVGAVITDKFFSIKSTGWNNTPEGQTPCLLRNAEDLINNTDSKSFSSYEKGAVVKEMVNQAVVMKDRSNLVGRNLCFCFKQVQNVIESQKNQVHTRALHAEENAMLQISKYGGEGIKDGHLFSTASPCELCSKKAYQLGIKKIYYIDPYPGISSEQILDSGADNSKPKLILFNGAVGKAYHSIFEPFMSYKDELDLRLNVDYSKAKLKLDRTDLNKKNKRISQLKEQKARIEKDIMYLEDTDELN